MLRDSSSEQLPHFASPGAGFVGVIPTSSAASTSRRVFSVLEVLARIRSPRVMAELLPSALRMGWLGHGTTSASSAVRAAHSNVFDWQYLAHEPGLSELYSRAQRGQWNEEDALPWQTSVDPEDPTKPLLPDDFFDFERARSYGIQLSPEERRALKTCFVAWMLSQFMHGEQGALYAAAQSVESTHSLSAKKVAATQVVDEARHVAVFQRYLDTKLVRRYTINDNLYVTIDALIGESRWDVKFIGMQIIVEGLALSAFGNLHKRTREPLLHALLHRVLQDEARHVQFGLLMLRDYVPKLSERERRQREDWALEVSLLMRDRFLAYEVYDEWFAHRISRKKWRELMLASSGMQEFQRIMFSRLLRNLRSVGLSSERLERRLSAETTLDLQQR